MDKRVQRFKGSEVLGSKVPGSTLRVTFFPNF